MSELARILAATRTVAASIATREAIACGPFDAYIETRRRERWFSFAVPHDGARPSAADVATLIALFAARERIARVECFPALAPEAVRALRDGGFEEELTGPVMACARHVAAPEVAGLTLERLTPASPASSIVAFDEVQTRAFGDDPGVTDVDGYRLRLARNTSLLARLDGEPAGAGVVTDPAGGCAEVAGIGTAAQLRGRGIGAAVVSALAGHALDAGAELLFLTSNGADSTRIYERAGFATIGEFMHLSAPTR